MTYEVKVNLPEAEEGVDVTIADLGTFKNGASTEVDDDTALKFLEAVGFTNAQSADFGPYTMQKLSEEEASAKEKPAKEKPNNGEAPNNGEPPKQAKPNNGEEG